MAETMRAPDMEAQQTAMRRLGFLVGEYRTETVLRINEKGEWTEDGKLMVGERVVKMIELRVGRVS